MITKQVNNITGSDAVDHAKSGGDLFFPDGQGMCKCYYNDEDFSFYFMNYQGQVHRTGWNEAHIANRTWEVLTK
ncbi:hypothetical protein BC7_00058 [Bacillus phage BC-7]|nr:hypothetical protein BC7_00058 [Bacillus phage BC-7]